MKTNNPRRSLEPPAARIRTAARLRVTAPVAIVTAILLAATVNAAAPDFAAFDQRGRGGERLNVVFFGASLTWGANATDPQLTSYRGRKEAGLRITRKDAAREHVHDVVAHTDLFIGTAASGLETGPAQCCLRLFNMLMSRWLDDESICVAGGTARVAVARREGL